MRSAHYRSLASWVALALLLLVSTGCLFFNKREYRMSRTTSAGAELEDLKRALDAGAITEDEYQRLEAAIKSQVSKSGEPEDRD